MEETGRRAVVAGFSRGLDALTSALSAVACRASVSRLPPARVARRGI